MVTFWGEGVSFMTFSKFSFSSLSAARKEVLYKGSFKQNMNYSGVSKKIPPKIDGGVRRKIQEKNFSSENSVKKIPLQIQELSNYQNLIPKKTKKKAKIAFIYRISKKLLKTDP